MTAPYRKREYRVYFSEGKNKFFLADIIVHDTLENPIFTVRHDQAMVFQNFSVAIGYIDRLRKMGYQVHLL